MSTTDNSTANPELALKVQAIVQTLNDYQYPEIYPYVYKLLIALSVFYFLVLAISILILCIPLFRGLESRRKHLWLWRRQFPPGLGHKIPYFVPNGAAAVVISQIFGSIIFEIYILLSYRAFRSPDFAKNAYQYFWLTISYSPGYFGFWYSGFGALYICLFSPGQNAIGSRAKRHYLPNPLIMNTICIGAPIFTTLGSIGWGIASVVTSRRKQEVYDSVIADLHQGRDPTADLEAYKVAGARFIAQFRWASFCWSIAALVAVMFYCFTIFLFLRLLKGVVDVASGKISLFTEPDPPKLKSDGLASDVEPSTQMVSATSAMYNSNLARKLRNSYRILIWHCGTLTVVLTWYFVVGVILTVKIGRVVDSESWRSVSVWVVVSSAVLLSGALLLESWRVLSDGQENKTGRPSPLKISQPPSGYDAVLELDLSPTIPQPSTFPAKSNGPTRSELAGQASNPLMILTDPVPSRVL